MAEIAVGNIVRRVLHIIREEDISLATDAIAGLGIAAGSDDEDYVEQDDHSVLSAAAVAAAARSTLRPPSLQTLLEDIPDSAAVPPTSSSGGESEGKSRCEMKDYENLYPYFVIESFMIQECHRLHPYYKMIYLPVLQVTYTDMTKTESMSFFYENTSVVLDFICQCLLLKFCNFFHALTAADKGSRGRKLKHDVIEAVNDLIQDINTCHEQIAEQAVEHIHQK